MTERASPPGPDRRRPRWVFSTGSEPDARFTFANERTFLAWIRTSLALIAGAVGLEALGVPAERGLRLTLALVLAGVGLMLPVVALIRWARNERALRRQTPLSATVMMPLLVGLLVVVGAIVILAAVLASHS